MGSNFWTALSNQAVESNSLCAVHRSEYHDSFLGRSVPLRLLLLLSLFHISVLHLYFNLIVPRSSFDLTFAIVPISHNSLSAPRSLAQPDITKYQHLRKSNTLFVHIQSFIHTPIPSIVERLDYWATLFPPEGALEALVTCS